ncbi:MAG: ABC transporter permease [Alphaproteobacteria bacterium]|nr:ABC transporter permease [Alphaproteobacteria bacterium]
MKRIAIVLSRLLWFVPTLLGLIALVFSISHIIPADPVRIIAGDQATAEQIDALRTKLGLDRPLWEQFLSYLARVAQGDLGMSLFSQRPIVEDLMARLPATLELGVSAVLLAVSVGVPLGVVSAVYRNSPLDHVVRVVSVSGLAIASFWLAMELQLLFSMKLAWTPLSGRIAGFPPEPRSGFMIIDALMDGDREALDSALRHLALPTLTLALPAAAQLVRLTRAGVLEVINSNHVLYQRAMGFPGRVIIWKYVLRAAMTATVTQIGLIFGVYVLAGAIVVETVFDWPGIGLFAVNSILRSDYNGIVGFTIWAGLIFIVVNLVVDVVHSFIDPRIVR